MKKRTTDVVYETPEIKIIEMNAEGVLCSSLDHVEPQLPDLEDGGDILI